MIDKKKKERERGTVGGGGRVSLGTPRRLVSQNKRNKGTQREPPETCGGCVAEF